MKIETDHILATLPPISGHAHYVCSLHVCAASSAVGPDTSYESSGHIETVSSTFGDSKKVDTCVLEIGEMPVPGRPTATLSEDLCFPSISAISSSGNSGHLQKSHGVSSLSEREESEKTVPIYCGECPIPKCMTQTSTLYDCTNKGMTYVDETNDVILEIPEGAIPEEERLTVDVGVALFGPFQFPEGLRPVSPVFWACVRDNSKFQFLKPVTVTIPHFLDLDNEDKMEFLGLTFLKAHHNKNSAGLYEFQPLTEGEMDFNTLRTHGILGTLHFCSLCLAAKFIPRSTEFCITSVVPHCPGPVGKNVGGCFFVTFMNLKTCLEKVETLINKMYREGYKTRRVPFRFKSDTEDPALEMTFSQPKHGQIGWKGKNKVND